MKKAVLRHLTKKYQNFSFLALNQFLYVVKQNYPITKNAPGDLEFERMQILRTFKLESNVRFDVIENKEVVAISEEQ